MGDLSTTKKVQLDDICLWLDKFIFV